MTANDPSNTNEIDMSQMSPTARSSYTLFDHSSSYPILSEDLSAREELKEGITEEHTIEMYVGNNPLKPTIGKGICSPVVSDVPMLHHYL